MTDTNIRSIIDQYIVIWLDKTIETNKENCDVKALIRQKVRGRLFTFVEPDECIDRIVTGFETKQIVLIISNEFGPDVVPIIHACTQIHTIYVYCADRQRAEQWTKPFTKVAAIFTDKKALLHKICDNGSACEKDRHLPMSVFHLEDRQRSLQNLSSESTTFMWYQFILTVLRLMAKYCNAKTDMINECRANYHDDDIEKKKIDEFEQNYTSSKAFWWYTYDSFVYRLLNKALRTQHTEIIFKFRFFINDLHNQIVQLYRQYLRAHPSSVDRCLAVYRGQRLGMNEVDLLRRNVNQLISMNTFLSATRTKELAVIFADTSDQHNQASPLQSVLFTIEVNDMSEDRTPFAFIESYSCYQDEEEVLFSIGAIFRVESVTEVENIWHVKLQLSKQQNELCHDLSNYMIREIGSEPSPLCFGWFLYRMSEFNKSERYTEWLLEQLSPNAREAGDVYNLLGLIHKAKNNMKSSIDSYKKALEIYVACNAGNSVRMINTHNNLGLAYFAIDDYNNAEEQQKQAERKLPSFGCRHKMLSLATSSLNAKLQAIHGHHKNALKIIQHVLKEKTKKLPPDHPSMATTLNDMGIIYEKFGSHEVALRCFTQAFNILEKSLPRDHIDLAECLKNMGRINERLQNSALASKQYQLASSITDNSSRPTSD